MEHRWGERIEVDIPVQVSVPPSVVGSGRMRNVSISGAWILGKFDLPPLARAFVVFDLAGTGGTEQLPIACYVARVRPDGIGVEWRELAPEIVGDLMLFAAPAPVPQPAAPETPVAAVESLPKKTQAG